MRVIFDSYRGVSDEDLERERANEEQIKKALALSKRAMKFGDTFGAVSALEAVKQVTRLQSRMVQRNTRDSPGKWGLLRRNGAWVASFLPYRKFCALK